MCFEHLHWIWHFLKLSAFLWKCQSQCRWANFPIYIFFSFLGQWCATIFTALLSNFMNRESILTRGQKKGASYILIVFCLCCLRAVGTRVRGGGGRFWLKTLFFKRPWITKGQTKSKCFFQTENSSKKWTKKFCFFA